MKDFFSNLFKKATDFVAEQAQNLEKLKDTIGEQFEQMRQQEEEKLNPKPQVCEVLEDSEALVKLKLPDGTIVQTTEKPLASRLYADGSAMEYVNFTEKGLQKLYVSRKDGKIYEISIVEADYTQINELGNQFIEWEHFWVSIGLNTDAVKLRVYNVGKHEVETINSHGSFSLSYGHFEQGKPKDHNASLEFWETFYSKLPADQKPAFEAGATYRQESLATAIDIYKRHLKQVAYFEKMDTIMAERKQELIDAGEWEEPTYESDNFNSSSSSSSSKSSKEEKSTKQSTQSSGKAKNISIKIKNDTDEPFTVYNQGSGGSYRLAKNVITTIKMDEGDKLFYYEGGKKGHLILTASPDMEGKVQNYSKL